MAGAAVGVAGAPVVAAPLVAVRDWLAAHDLAAGAGEIRSALAAVGPGVVAPHHVRVIAAELAGAGPLQRLLDDPDVTDVLVHGGGRVWVDHGDGLRPEQVELGGEEAVRALAVRLAGLAGRRLDLGQPVVDAVLPDGHRLHAVLPPLAVDGTAIAIRAHRPYRWTLEDVAGPAAEYVAALVAAGRSCVVSGATGAGKTTLLAAMLGRLDPGLRVVVVEDTTELPAVHPQLVRLQARLSNVEGAGAVGMRSLVREALRMRPDRLVVGEVRGAEVLDLLVALNTGHRGGLCTAHANGVAEVPRRIEALAALAGLPGSAAARLLGSALDVAIQVRRSAAGRQVCEIGVFQQKREGEVSCDPAMVFDRRGARRGPAAASLERLLGPSS